MKSNYHVIFFLSIDLVCLIILVTPELKLIVCSSNHTKIHESQLLISFLLYMIA